MIGSVCFNPSASTFACRQLEREVFEKGCFAGARVAQDDQPS
jgi:hypothetical protein